MTYKKESCTSSNTETNDYSTEKQIEVSQGYHFNLIGQ